MHLDSNLRMAVGVPMMLGALICLRCDKPYREFETDQVCRDVGYAISARTLDCSGDEKLAQERYASFEAAYTCRVSSLEFEPIDVYYHCVYQISEAGCDEAERYGNDLIAWLSLSPACAQFLSGPGLRTADGGPDAGLTVDGSTADGSATVGGVP